MEFNFDELPDDMIAATCEQIYLAGDFGRLAKLIRTSKKVRAICQPFLTEFRQERDQIYLHALDWLMRHPGAAVYFVRVAANGRDEQASYRAFFNPGAQMFIENVDGHQSGGLTPAEFLDIAWDEEKQGYPLVAIIYQVKKTDKFPKILDDWELFERYFVKPTLNRWQGISPGSRHLVHNKDIWIFGHVPQLRELKAIATRASAA
ncbi:MAG: hypothetical protein ACYCOU_08125 [Sulfobacillus sp.]